MSRQDTETRLRAALSSIDPLVRDSEAPGLVTTARAPRPRARFALIAAAAIAAVIAVLVPYLLIDRSDNSQPAEPSGPPFFVSFGDVYDSATGNQISAIDLGRMRILVAGPDGHTFYYLIEGGCRTPSKLARIVLDNQGRVASTKIVMYRIFDVPSAAVSPAGTRLAVSVSSWEPRDDGACASGGPTELRVLNLQTMQTRTWPATYNTTPYYLVWLADNRTLFYDGADDSGSRSLWTLDTTGPTGNPTEIAERVTSAQITLPDLGTGHLYNPARAADGDQIVASFSTGERREFYRAIAIVTIDPATGEVTAVDERIARHGAERVVFDASGEVALVFDEHHNRLGRYVDGEVSWFKPSNEGGPPTGAIW